VALQRQEVLQLLVAGRLVLPVEFELHQVGRAGLPQFALRNLLVRNWLRLAKRPMMLQ
jgi:hypothetical protein